MDCQSLLAVRKTSTQRIRAAWGHEAHRVWARRLLDRRRDLIDNGPRATRSASGKTDGEQQQQQYGGHRCPKALGSFILTPQTERASSGTPALPCCLIPRTPPKKCSKL